LCAGRQGCSTAPTSTFVRSTLPNVSRARRDVAQFMLLADVLLPAR